MLPDDFRINPQVLSNPQIRNIRNETTIDLGNSKWQGLKQFFMVPSIQSKQGWTVTWKPQSTTNTETVCRTCRGNKLMYKKDIIGRIKSLQRCITCNGTGKVFRERLERSNR